MTKVSGCHAIVERTQIVLGEIILGEMTPLLLVLWREKTSRRQGIPMYCLSTPPVISEGQWIEANAKLIRQFGPEVYLRQLLDTMKQPA
jgi:hypothetical protein